MNFAEEVSETKEYLYQKTEMLTLSHTFIFMMLGAIYKCTALDENSEFFKQEVIDLNLFASKVLNLRISAYSRSEFNTSMEEFSSKLL